MKSGLFTFDPQPGVVPPGSITNAELADMAARTVKVNATNASASPQDLQGTTPLDVLRVNAAGDGLEWGAPTNGLYVLKAGDTMTGPLVINRASFAAPSAPADTILHLNGIGTGSQSRFLVDAVSNNSRAVWAMRRARDAGSGVPSAVQSGDGLGAIGAFGYGATAYSSSARAGIDFEASENWTDANQGARVGLRSTLNGAAAGAIRMYVQGGLYTVNATGGDQGADTVNASNYFDDGVNINTIYAGLAGAVFTGAVSISTAAETGLSLSRVDAGSSGPAFDIYHQSSSPAASDAVARIRMRGNDSAGNVTDYVLNTALIVSATDGAEAGEFLIATAVAGSLGNRVRVRNGLYMNGATGGDQGANTVNATSFYANSNIIADTNGLLRRRAYTFGTLPAAGTAMRHAYITDGAAVPVWAAAAAGGGAVVTPVTDNGTIWING